MTKDEVIQARSEEFDAALAVAQTEAAVAKARDALNLARAEHDRAVMALQDARSNAAKAEQAAIHGDKGAAEVAQVAEVRS